MRQTAGEGNRAVCALSTKTTPLESLGDLRHAETLFEWLKQNFVWKFRAAICRICDTSGFDAVLSYLLLGPVLSRINPHSVPSKRFVFRCPVRNSVGTTAIQIETFDDSQTRPVRLNVCHSTWNYTTTASFHTGLCHSYLWLSADRSSMQRNDVERRTARGGAVGRATALQLEGRGFDSRLCQLNFLLA